MDTSAPKTSIIAASVGIALLFSAATTGVVFAFRAIAGLPLIPIFAAEAERGAPSEVAAVLPRTRPPTPQPEPALPLSASVGTVPFTTQAPLGKWGQPFQDACEEASVLMAMAWVEDDKTILPAEAATTIRDIVAFEEFYFGYHRDTDIRDTAAIFTSYFEYPNVKIRYDIGLADIKREIARGNLVIIPVSGFALKNPAFKSPPPHHMIVVTGYDDVRQEFTTHDPGTRLGKDYRYSYDVIDQALHDWTGSPETILTGRRGMIVVSRLR